MIDLLKITITKTADGQQEYLQIMSGDMLMVNVVLIAEKIKIEDMRDD